MKFRTLIIVTALIVAAAQAIAADVPQIPRLVRGTIAAIDGKSVTITEADGTTVTGAIAATTIYSAVEARRLDQIKPTDFVGITSVPGPNGTLMAEEIHIIPLKGLGEGSYPWDHHPAGARSSGAGSMTNATVAGVNTAGATTAGSMTNGTVTAGHASQLLVTYHGSTMVNGRCVGLAARTNPCTGTATVDVTPQTAIVAIVPAKPTDARAGLAVFASMANGPDGKPVVGSMVLERNGVKPQF